MLTQLFLAAWLWIVLRIAERPRLIWLLPILQLVWVNCHALFVLGLVVGAAYARLRRAGICRRTLGVGASGQATSGQTIVRAGALVAVACLANPYFEEGAKFPLTLYRKFSWSITISIQCNICEFSVRQSHSSKNRFGKGVSTGKV